MKVEITPTYAGALGFERPYSFQVLLDDKVMAETAATRNVTTVNVPVTSVNNGRRQLKAVFAVLNDKSYVGPESNTVTLELAVP